MANDNLKVTIEVVVKRETERAWGVADPRDAGRIQWLPKSQCTLEGTEITAPEWLLKDRGLI